tara:strand:- start:597 stop:980 length:384 start_codon:yes stop_codon:yes gene_type:complete
MIKALKISAGAIAMSAALLVEAPAGAGDVKAGEKVFKKCKACHYADREKHKTGPHLVNITGRAAGGLEDYKKYSKAMKASGIVWDDTTLADYLRAPKKYVKGTKMAFAGLKKDADIENVIAYLKAEK